MLGVICAAVPAGAHGPTPAILGVVASIEGSPRVLALTEGLALRRGDRWVFVCPSLFGSPLVPRALSSDGRSTWVASDTSTFLLDEEGKVHPAPLPAGDGTVTALVNTDEDRLSRFASPPAEPT